MTTIQKSLTYLALVLVLFACSKEDNLSKVNNDILNQNLALNKTERNVAAPLRNLTDDWFVAKNNEDEFYIHNANNIADVNLRGMMLYNATTNTFTNKAKNGEVTAAGDQSQLVYENNNTGGCIHYIANEAVTYRIATNDWEANAISFPANVRLNFGEGKSCLTNNRIYYVGGRNQTKVVKYYDLSAGNWQFVAQYPIEITYGPELAATTNNFIYALGGGLNPGNSKEFFRYDIVNNTWLKLADAPIAPKQYYTLKTMVCYKNNYLVYYGNDNKLHSYNIEKEEWQNNAVDTGLSTYPHMEVATDNSKIFLLYRKNNAQLGLQEYQ